MAVERRSAFGAGGAGHAASAFLRTDPGALLVDDDDEPATAPAPRRERLAPAVDVRDEEGGEQNEAADEASGAPRARRTRSTRAPRPRTDAASDSKVKQQCGLPVSLLPELRPWLAANGDLSYGAAAVEGARRHHAAVLAAARPAGGDDEWDSEVGTGRRTGPRDAGPATQPVTLLLTSRNRDTLRAKAAECRMSLSAYVTAVLQALMAEPDPR